jgi:hypothetical protein
MSIIISTQSYKNEVPTTFGYLLELNDNSGTVIRKAKIETPVDCKFRGDRIKPGLRGIYVYENLIYTSTWNKIVVLRLDTFEIIRTISHQWMSDLHGIFVNEDGIWVTSSLPDAVILYDFDGSPISALWLPETSLYEKRIQVNKSSDWRSRGKNYRGFLEFHANHVEVKGDYVFITGRGQGKKEGRIIRVDKRSFINGQNMDDGNITLFARNLHGPHDGIWDSDKVWVTETLGSTLTSINGYGKVINRKKVLASENDRVHYSDTKEWLKYQILGFLGKPGKKMTHWTRGLCLYKGNFFVGQSQMAGILDAGYSAARIIKINKEKMKITDCFYLDIKDYPETRIFQIFANPELE